MRKLVLTTIAVVALMACNSDSGTEEVATAQMPDLTSWLDSIDNLGDVTAEEMAAIEGEYEARTAGVDASTLSEEDKKSFEMAQSRWQAFKMNAMPMEEEIEKDTGEVELEMEQEMDEDPTITENQNEAEESAE